MNPLVESANALKLGLFCTNGTGASQTLAPERHTAPSWERSVRTAHAAEAAGFEAVVPFARWKGYPENRPEHPSGMVLDPFTWAAGIAASTERIGVLATSHAPTVHPIVAAKQAATVDLISGGRFALNVVGGWNRPELEMFGAPLREHDERYDHLQEWLQVIRRLWSETEEFDFHGSFFDVVGGVSQPKPAQSRIPIMNAGGSARGMRFAAEHADLCFLIVQSEDEAGVRKQVQGYKDMARSEFGRDVQVWTHTVVVQRDSQAEADAALHRFSVELEDTESVDAWMRLQGANTEVMPPEILAAMRQRMAAGAGGFPLVGTAEGIAERLEMLSTAGIDGALLTWVDYDAGLADFTDGVVPLLQKAGLRT
ncbi:LLM class flavin-dependent oxidoreductase [Pseudonocardia kujensis]|uniref:LLM class flavin-dependent oxidoreductase n=1 Tax=Pseudonocardia kujensis TaxID=1128675 RepID=UPI001E659537|nr:LLM class flavin-dependent oxidoreductase [Pseudonocardia kujensis]MCE0765543.1 LLM class flavin-dependent oxidoreductase [Pseudonocardia kujensis]